MDGKCGQHIVRHTAHGSVTVWQKTVERLSGLGVSKTHSSVDLHSTKSGVRSEEFAQCRSAWPVTGSAQQRCGGLHGSAAAAQHTSTINNGYEETRIHMQVCKSMTTLDIMLKIAQ